MLKDISCIIQDLHKQKITHRKLTLDSVRIKKAGNSMKLILAGFELASKHQPRTKFSEAINLELMKNFEKSQPNGASTDIFALG